MTWYAAWQLAKKFGPYLLVVLLLFGVWMHGKSKGKEKWSEKYQKSQHEVKQLEREKVEADSEIFMLRATLDQQNESIKQMGVEHDNRVKEAQEAHQRILRDQATSYQRQLLEAAEGTKELRERVRLLPVAETCHEAWAEVSLWE